MTARHKPRVFGQPLILDTALFQDPYALWAVHTDFRTFKRRQTALAGELTFLAELFKPYDPKAHFTGAIVVGTTPIRLLVPPAYAQALPATHANACFVTLRLPVEGLTSAQLRAVVMALFKDKLVKRLQIGFQRPGYKYPTPLVGGAEQPAMGAAPQAAAPSVVLGLVEDACPFAHAAVLRNGSTRVAALWDQSIVPTPLAPWTLPAAFPYGRQLSQVAMNGLIQQCIVDGSLDEDALYADVRVAMPELMLRASHGAAVLALLAGKSTDLGRGTPQDGVPTVLSAAQRAADDCLQNAPVVVVRLPREQTTISAGRWLAVNAVDALHGIIGMAMDLAPEAPPPPLVVNVSYGAIAGPHDGSSMIESAVDELCAGYKSMAVVLAAGNAHGTVRNTDALDQTAVLPGGVHASANLGPGQTATFTLLAPADKAFETYLELWFSDSTKDLDPALEQRLTAADVGIQVIDPNGQVWPDAPLRCGSQHYAPSDGKDTVAGLVFVHKPSQSLHRSMALLVLAATRLSADFVEAPAGRWTVLVSNLRQPGEAGARPLSVQAWVERDDSTYGIDRPQSARLVPNDDGEAGHLNDRNILSNLASGLNTLSVGALVQGVVASPAHGMVSAYSAAGPSQNQGPELSALADAGLALSGIRTAGSQSGMVVRTNGTSMAAPLAARWIAQQLANGTTLAQIKAMVLAAPGRNARRGMTVP